MTSPELHACRCPAVNFARCKRHATPAPSVTAVRQISSQPSTRPCEQSTTAYRAGCVSCRSSCWPEGPEGLVSCVECAPRRPRREITAVVNTGDDVTMHGLRICPDLDTVMYTLGGGIDEERGWGRAGESWTVKEELAAYGADPDWFGLGDRDLATHLIRTRMLDAGYPLSAVTAALADRWQPGVTAAADERPAGRDPRRGRPTRRPAGSRRSTSRSGGCGTAPRWTPSAFVQVGVDAARPGPGRDRGVRRRRRRPARAVQPGGVDRHDPRRARPARRAAGARRPGSSASRRSSAARSCAGWPTAACPCSASRSAPRASGRHYGARAAGGLLDAWLVAPGRRRRRARRRRPRRCRC